ncbi:MAG TPA: hypothetical protein VNI84_01465 [Pyrinomonadaceae bacterium]|nr:hypothetical protein [Pyrinomonadaceae bacterium]
MKNLKNIAAATTLTAVLMMSATSAQAGLLMSDRAIVGEVENTQITNQQCSENNDTSLFAQIKGIIIVGMNGLLMSDAPTVESECTTDGVIMTDGLLMSDGLLISD